MSPTYKTIWHLTQLVAILTQKGRLNPGGTEGYVELKNKYASNKVSKISIYL